MYVCMYVCYGLSSTFGRHSYAPDMRYWPADRLKVVTVVHPSFYIHLLHQYQRCSQVAVEAMPSEHRNTLLHLMQFLTLVAVQSDSNKMGMPNLALIFAPSVLRSSDLNPLLELSSIKVWFGLVLYVLVGWCTGTSTVWLL